MNFMTKVLGAANRASKISLVKNAIKQEEKMANEAFIALGKYYYYNLRDASNDETEFYCEEVDYAEQRLQKAELRLSKLLRKDPEVFVTEEGYVCTFTDDVIPQETEEAAPAAEEAPAEAAPAEAAAEEEKKTEE